MSSLVVTSGTVHSRIRIQEKQARFSLRNDNGTFFINAPGPVQIKLCQALSIGDPICIIARLRGYRNRSCGKHHVYLEAMSVMTLDEEHALVTTEPGFDLLAMLTRLDP